MGFRQHKDTHATPLEFTGALSGQRTPVTLSPEHLLHGSMRLRVTLWAHPGSLGPSRRAGLGSLSPRPEASQLPASGQSERLF